MGAWKFTASATFILCQSETTPSLRLQVGACTKVPGGEILGLALRTACRLGRKLLCMTDTVRRSGRVGYGVLTLGINPR